MSNRFREIKAIYLIMKKEKENKKTRYRSSNI